MNEFLTSHKNPPVSSYGGLECWERSSDPFHPDAFPKDMDIKDAVVIGGEISKGKRRHGWMAIDWAGNPVGFVPDGTKTKEDNSGKYDFKIGPFKKMCAYPITR